MQPKVTIIIPVYNVEQYLRQCLDSVLNQTMREIQVVCVNDGSTDGSLAVLREYEFQDSRIEVIDKSNGGVSTARNAAYSSVKGKYMLFVDADDWIEPDLCEKTYQKAEKTGAQMTFFFLQGEEEAWRIPFHRRLALSDKTTVEEKLPILDFNEVCAKLWRTGFLLDNNLYFPEGFAVGEDMYVCWKAVTLADKISIVPEYFYHIRSRPGSATRAMGEHTIHIFPVYEKIREYLLESGYYMAYRDKFLSRKLDELRGWYHRFPASMLPRYVAKIRESFSEEDREFYRTAPRDIVPKHLVCFCEMIDSGQSPMAVIKYYVALAMYGITTKSPRQIFQWITMRIMQQKRGT